MRELLLGVQEGISVQTDVGLVDSLAAERVAHPFAGHDGSHEGDDVLQAAGQLEDDDDQGDGHTGHTTWGQIPLLYSAESLLFKIIHLLVLFSSSHNAIVAY